MRDFASDQTRPPIPPAGGKGKVQLTCEGSHSQRCSLAHEGFLPPCPENQAVKCCSTKDCLPTVQTSKGRVAACRPLCRCGVLFQLVTPPTITPPCVCAVGEHGELGHRCSGPGAASFLRVPISFPLPPCLPVLPHPCSPLQWASNDLMSPVPHFKGRKSCKHLSENKRN